MKHTYKPLKFTNGAGDTIYECEQCALRTTNTESNAECKPDSRVKARIATRKLFGHY